MTNTCLLCSKEFEQPIRKQGGGSRRLYCSPACRSLNWVRGNPGKRNLALQKYERKPESVEKKKLRAKKQKFKAYGITEEDFNTQLLRQNNRCAGCSVAIDTKSACIDHDHATGRFRGLLCKYCNWGIGHLRDSKETLYKLAAYLNHDVSKKKVYVIGSLRNQKVIEISKQIRTHGFSVFDDWISAGPEADDYFQKYHTERGFSFAEALQGEVAQHIFYFDKAHLDLSDYGVLVMPAGKSGHLELGYLAGRGKKTFILLDKPPDRHDIMPQFAKWIVNSVDELLEVLKHE